MVDDDDGGLDVAQYLLGGQPERGSFTRPHRVDPRRGFAVCRHNPSTRRSGGHDNKQVCRDVVRQRHLGTKVPTVRACTCHPHIVAAANESDLAAGLYPNVL